MTYTTYDMGTGAPSLGTQTAEYKPRRGAFVRLFIGFIMAVVSVFGILYALLGKSVAPGDRWPIILLAVFGFLIGWVLIENWVGKQKLRVQIFTDGEYRRDIFTADITKAMDGFVPGK